MKRIVTFIGEPNRKKEIVSISAPVSENNTEILDSIMSMENAGFIDAGYQDPPHIAGKRLVRFYDPDTQTVEFDYIELGFNDYDLQGKVAFLKAQTEGLVTATTDQIKLTQDAILDVADLLLGMQ